MRSATPAAACWSLFPLDSLFCCGHGAQTDLNKLEVCQGRRLNPPLNEKGRGQARTLLPGADFSAIVCSPLRRARETAEIVRERCEDNAVEAFLLGLLACSGRSECDIMSVLRFVFLC